MYVRVLAAYCTVCAVTRVARSLFSKKNYLYFNFVKLFLLKIRFFFSFEFNKREKEEKKLLARLTRNPEILCTKTVKRK